MRLHLLMLLAGVAVSATALTIDIDRVLQLVRFPSGELNNQWVVRDLATLRTVALATALLLALAAIVLLSSRAAVGRLAQGARAFGTSAARHPLVIPMAIVVLILLKTVIQLGLYVAGYSAYAADDFSRSLSADYWLQHRTFDFGSGGWVGLHDSAWLPFSDYLFGIGLAIHRDIFLTPKVVNVLVSGAVVVVSYLLGRELFGRLVGLFTAALIAFQPWFLWIGWSGMTSDLPSAALIGVCGLFLARSLRTGKSGALLASAAAVAAADGFRYENWLFSAVFSLLISLIGVWKWKQGRFGARPAIDTIGALAIANAVPILWMTASRLALGVWLPALRVVGGYSDLALNASSSPTAARTIGMPLLLLGCFPFEVVLSMAGAILLLRSDREKPFRPYLVLPCVAFLFFGEIFKWRVPAWMMIGRYFLTFVVLLAPFAGFVVARLIRSASAWREEALAAACLILAAVGLLDMARIINYPAMFPRDAIAVGWAVRNLQMTGEILPVDKILIERTPDWGHLGIVALANRPERFVLLEDSRGTPADQPSVGARGAPPPISRYLCGDDLAAQPCRERIESEGFRFVILSSETRAASFGQSFQTTSWRIGRFQLFELGRRP